MKNGIVPVVLDEQEVAEIIRRAQTTENYRVTVDLECCQVTDKSGFSASFEMDDFRRHCLIEGLDDIGLTLKVEPQVSAYEATRQPWRVSLN